MPLTIPNSADAAFGAQSEPDSRDFDAIVAAMGGTCVLAGCAVTAQGVPNMTVAVAAGTIASSTTVASVTGGNVTIAANASGNPRFDLVVATAAGALAARQGTAAVNPTFPTLTAGDVMLAAVWVPNGAASIATNQIVDKRALTDYPTAAPVALSAAANSGSALTLSLSDHVHPTTGLGVLASANTWTNTNVYSALVTAQVGLTVGTNAGVSVVLGVDAAAAQQKDINFQTAGVRRWLFRSDAGAESGSNAGSNFQFYSFDDAGATLWAVWSVVRSTGVTTYGKPVSFVFDAVVGNNPVSWSHSNTAYRGSLGAYSSGGHPFVGLHAEHSTTANQMRNDGSGVRGAVISAGQVSADGVSIVMGDTATANATWTTPWTLATFQGNGGTPILHVGPTAASYIQLQTGTTGTASYIRTAGTDANVILGVIAKGTGSVDINVAAGGGTGGFRWGDAANNVKGSVDSAGRMGLGAANAGSSMLEISGATGATGLSTYGLNVHPTFPSASTTEINGLRVQMTTPGTVYTVATAVALRVVSTSLGAGSIITANYGIWVEPRTVGTSDYGVRIDSAQTQTLWLSADVLPTTAAQSIAWGSARDTNLYRAGTSSLKTDGQFSVYQTSTIGGLTISNSTSGPYHIILARSDVASSQLEFWNNGTSFILANNAGTTIFSVDQSGRAAVGGSANAGTSIFEVAGIVGSGASTTSYGVNLHATANTASTTEFNELRIQMTTQAVVHTIATAVALRIASTSLGAGSVITDNYGIWVEPRTVGTNDYGVRIDSAQTQTLWISGDVTPTTSAQGIAFGSGKDTNVYRITTNVLRVGNIVDAVTGFRIGGAATTAHYLRGNGTNYVDAAIAAGDLPTSGIPNVAYLNVANQFTLVNTFTAANSTVVRAMSGASGSWAAYGLGRTALEAYYGISNGASAWFTGDVAGDAALQLAAGKLHLGVGSPANYAQLQVDTTKVLVPVQMVLGTNAGTMHYYPHVASYDSQASVTGAIIISTPLTWSVSQMTTLYVRGYVYDRQVNIDFTVSFYPYSGGSASANPINITFTDLGNDGLVKRIGVDAGGKIAVSIGDVGTLNYFAHVIVDAEITQSNTTFPTGWSVSTTTTAGFGWTATNLLTSNTTTTGNITINQIGTGGTQANGYVRLQGTTLNGTYLRYTDSTQLFTIEDNSPTARVTVNLATGDTTFARYATAAGFQVAGAAASGQYIRGDGTKGVFSAILAADVPVSYTVAHTFTVANASAVIARSGAAGSWTRYDLGRTSTEGEFGVSGGSSVFFTGDAAGDIAIRASNTSANVHVGVGTARAQMVVSNGSVIFNQQGARAITLRTNLSTTWTGIDLGRTGTEIDVAIEGTSNTFFSTSNAGDAIYRLVDTTKTIRIGLGTNANAAHLALTNTRLTTTVGISMQPAYTAGTVQEHLFAYGSSTSWPFTIAYLGDASYVDHWVTLNGRVTGGTRGAPTLTSGSGTGMGFMHYDPSAGTFYVGIASGGAGVSPKNSIQIDANSASGRVGVGVAPIGFATLGVSSLVTTDISLVIRAITSQSAELVKWQSAGGAADLGVYDVSGVLRQFGPSAGTTEYASRVTADTSDRWLQTADGTMKWGPGNATQDTTLARVAVGVLQLSGELNIVGQSAVVTNLVNRAPSGMAADYEQFQDSSSNVLSRVDGQGYAMFKNFDEKMEWGFYPSYTAATFKLINDVGLTLTTSGTLTLGALTGFPSMVCTTGAVSGNTSGVISSSAIVIGTYNPEFHARIYMDATITNIRVWVGLVVNDMSATGVVTTQTCLAFRFDTGVPDTKWQCISSDGTSGSGTDSGVTVVASTAYNLAIVRNTNAANEYRFYINGNLVATKSVNMPALSALLKTQLCVTTLTTAARSFEIGFCKVRYD